MRNDQRGGLSDRNQVGGGGERRERCALGGVQLERRFARCTFVGAEATVTGRVWGGGRRRRPMGGERESILYERCLRTGDCTERLAFAFGLAWGPRVRARDERVQRVGDADAAGDAHGGRRGGGPQANDDEHVEDGDQNAGQNEKQDRRRLERVLQLARRRERTVRRLADRAVRARNPHVHDSELSRERAGCEDRDRPHGGRDAEHSDALDGQKRV